MQREPGVRKSAKITISQPLITRRHQNEVIGEKLLVHQNPTKTLNIEKKAPLGLKYLFDRDRFFFRQWEIFTLTPSPDRTGQPQRPKTSTLLGLRSPPGIKPAICHRPISKMFHV